MSIFTTTAADSCFHVVPMGFVSFNRMYQLLSFYKSRFSRVVGFLPTGWAFGKSISRTTKRTSGPLTIFGVPYSEHSNYNELRSCVGWLKPSQIIPTVDCHTPEKVKAILSHFEDCKDVSSQSTLLPYLSSTLKSFVNIFKPDSPSLSLSPSPSPSSSPSLSLSPYSSPSLSQRFGSSPSSPFSSISRTSSWLSSKGQSKAKTKTKSKEKKSNEKGLKQENIVSAFANHLPPLLPNETEEYSVVDLSQEEVESFCSEPQETSADFFNMNDLDPLVVQEQELILQTIKSESSELKRRQSWPPSAKSKKLKSHSVVSSPEPNPKPNAILSPISPPPSQSKSNFCDLTGDGPSTPMRQPSLTDFFRKK